MSVYKVHGLSIEYSHDPADQPRLYYPLKYRWKYLPSGVEGEQTVYVKGQREGYALLSYWNQLGADAWFYRPLPF